MPAVMPARRWRAPMSRRSTSERASSNETSVKTAMPGSEIQDVPDALAGSRAVPVVVRQDLVAAAALLRGDDDAPGLAAHAQLLDAHAVVLGDEVLHLRLAPPRRLG